MLALELDKAEVKGFMGKLLREGMFDGFEVRTVEIAAKTRVTIDGKLEAEENEKTGFAMWEETRPLVYEIIKLSAKPRLVKIVFSWKGEIHTNAAALFLNLVYENDSVTFTTAAAQKEFVLDKSLDIAWDEWVRGFFAKTGVSVIDRE